MGHDYGGRSVVATTNSQANQRAACFRSGWYIPL